MKFRLARRFIGAGAALAIALGMGGGALPALAATTLTVNCPGSVYTAIQDAVNAAAAGSTIKVCAGTYEEYVSIGGKDNLKLIASGQVFVQPPIFPNPSNGPIIGVTAAHNVTIQGFVVRGAARFNSLSTTITGISFTDSSGTISKNFVLGIRREPMDSAYSGMGITVTNSTTTTMPVTIQSNTINDFQYMGISVDGNVKPTISKNVLKASSAAGGTLTGISIANAPGGKVTGKVSGNTVTFDTIWPYSSNTTGINIENSQLVQVAANKLADMSIGVNVSSNCGETTSNNKITGNIIRDASHGIKVVTSAMAACTTLTQTNQITANKLYDTMLAGAIGIQVSNCCTPDANADGNIVKGNQVYGYLGSPIDTTGTTTPLIGNKINLLPPPGF